MTYEQAVQKISTRLETPGRARGTIIVIGIVLVVSLLGLFYAPFFSMSVFTCAIPPSVAYVIWSIAALFYLRNKSLQDKPKEEMTRVMREATILLGISRGVGLAFFSVICLSIGLRMLYHFVGVADVICYLIMTIYLLLFVILCAMWRRMLIAIVEGDAWWVRFLFGGSAAVGAIASAAGAGLGILLARTAPHEVSSLVVVFLTFVIAFVGAPGVVFYLSEGYVHLQVRRRERQNLHDRDSLGA